MTAPTSGVAVNVKAWAKPVPAPVAGAHAGEAGVAARVDAGPVSLENKLIGYAQYGNGQVLVRGEKEAGVAVGSAFEADGRVRGTVTASLEKVGVDGRVSGNVEVGPVAVNGAVTGRVSAGVNGVRAGSSAEGGVQVGAVDLGGKVASSVALTDKLEVKGSAQGTANVGSAGIAGALAGAVTVTDHSLTVGGSAQADAHLGGYAVSLVAKGSVRADGHFPFLHVDASLSGSLTRPAAPAPAPAA